MPILLGGQNSIARTVENVAIGVEGIAKNVVRGWVGVDNIARRFYGEKEKELEAQIVFPYGMIVSSGQNFLIQIDFEFGAPPYTIARLYSGIAPYYNQTAIEYSDIATNVLVQGNMYAEYYYIDQILNNQKYVLYLYADITDQTGIVKEINRGYDHSDMFPRGSSNITVTPSVNGRSVSIDVYKYGILINIEIVVIRSTEGSKKHIYNSIVRSGSTITIDNLEPGMYTIYAAYGNVANETSESVIMNFTIE